MTDRHRPLPTLIAHAHPELDNALRNADESNGSLAFPVMDVLAHIDGARGGDSWHWILLLEDGSFAYVTGGAGDTGWDCCGRIDIFEENTIEAALRQVGEVHREELRAQLPKPSRPS